MKPEKRFDVNLPDTTSSDVTKIKSMSDKIRVLYVDDEINNLIGFKGNFRQHYEVFTASSAKEGMEVLEKEEVHVVVADQRMPKVSGVEFLKSIIEKYPEPVRVLLSGYTDMEAVVEAVNKAHIYRHIGKPVKEEEIAEAIDESYRHYSSNREQKELISTLSRANEQLEFMLREKLIS